MLQPVGKLVRLDMRLAGLVGERLEEVSADSRLIGRIADLRPFLGAFFELAVEHVEDRDRGKGLERVLCHFHGISNIAECV